MPAFENDGEGSVPDQVLPAELKLSHRLHGAAPGVPGAGGEAAAGTASELKRDEEEEDGGGEGAAFKAN